MADGWVSKEALKQQQLDDPFYKAAIIGLEGTPDAHKDPMQAYRYIVSRRNVIIGSHKQRPLIRLWDKDMNYIGRITGERLVDWQELMHSAGSGTVKILRSNWLAKFLIEDVRADEDLHITIDPRPTKRHWSTRWAGKVTAAHIKRTAEGTHEVQLDLISVWEHWRHIAFAANPVLPPEVQLPKIYMIAMNCRTAVCYTGIINLMRQYNPVMAIASNIFNPGHWLTPIADPALPGRNKDNSLPTLLNFNPLDWPVQMAFVNPVIDQSRFSFIVARWSMADAACEPILKDAGCFLRAVMFLEEDKDTPHTELADLVGQRLARPTRNAVVFIPYNKSGVTGPTGTLIDGIINLVGAVADDLLTEIIFPIDNDLDGITDPLFRKWLGVQPAKPKVIFRDGEYSGIIESDRIQYKAKARTIITGGKSPGWLNQAQTFAIRYALSKIAEAITSFPGAPAQMPGSEGIENVYQGQLDDTLFAFQKWTDPKRVFTMGSHALLEHIENGSGTAWTVSGGVTLRIGQWKTRPHTACKVSVVNGFPWFVYDDFELGDRVAFELAELLFTDQVSGIKWSYSDTEALKCELSIGTDEDEEDPFARGLRAIQGIWSVVGMILGDGGSTF
ncbi:minor tail protein [Mycobacterium phage JacoRen57]|nr:minor tail protein [Mycobacterium phage JacoRen57]